MKYSYTLSLMLCLAAGSTMHAEAFEIKNSQNFLPHWVTNWFSNKKKNAPLTINTEYQIEELIGAYPPKIYWIIDQLKKEDAPLLSNRLILYGPPGNGKSTLARSLARKAGCNILSLNGPSVVGSYLGEGAQKIRELFDNAAKLYEKTKKKTVVFIDEIDAICRANINYEAPARAEHQVATQELWLALDKYKFHPGIFFICATNHFDKLDRTFLDRFNTNTIEIQNPDAHARKNILLHYLKKHDLSFDEALLNALVKQSEGLSIRTLEDLVQDVRIALLMYGPTQVNSENVWELLRETKKKYVGNKETQQEATIRKWLDRCHIAHYALILPVCAAALYDLAIRIKHANSFGSLTGSLNTTSITGHANAPSDSGL